METSITIRSATEDEALGIDHDEELPDDVEEFADCDYVNAHIFAGLLPGNWVVTIKGKGALAWHVPGVFAVQVDTPSDNPQPPYRPMGYFKQLDLPAVPNM